MICITLQFLVALLDHYEFKDIFNYEWNFEMFFLNKKDVCKSLSKINDRFQLRGSIARGDF